MKKTGKDLAAIAREWAALDGQECSDWSEADLVEYFELAPWQSALQVQWSGGSFAGVKHYRGLYLAYNEVESYGPFEEFEDAEEALQISDEWDKIAHRSTSLVWDEDDF